MKKLVMNPSNKKYYSEEYIKGWEDGVKAQYEARQKGEWIDVNGDGSLWRCNQCKDTACCKGNYCTNCGADMRGEK